MSYTLLERQEIKLFIHNIKKIIVTEGEIHIEINKNNTTNSNKYFLKFGEELTLPENSNVNIINKYSEISSFKVV